MRIHRLFMSYNGVRIGDSGIQWETRGAVRSADKIMMVIRQFGRVAWYLTGNREEDKRFEKVLKAQDEGRVQKALLMLAERRKQRQSVRAVPGDTVSRGVTYKPPAHKISEPESPKSVPPLPVTANEEKQALPPLEPHPFEVNTGRIAEAVDEEPKSEDAFETEPVEETVLEAELLYLGDKTKEARELFDEALKSAPDDREILEWRDQAERKFGEFSTPPVSAASAAIGKTASGSPKISLDAESVCEALFDPDETTSSRNQMFESHFEGKSVRWTGSLNRASSFSFDFVLGNEPGCKAVVRIHELKTRQFSDGNINAVVRLPDSALETLKDREGHAITFEGRLVKLDGFMRNIFVMDGKLCS